MPYVAEKSMEMEQTPSFAPLDTYEAVDGLPRAFLKPSQMSPCPKHCDGGAALYGESFYDPRRHRKIGTNTVW